MRLVMILSALALAAMPFAAHADVPAYDEGQVRILIAAGKYDAAGAILDAALQKLGRVPMLFNLAAQIAALRDKDYETAVSEENAAITLDPAQAEFYYERGLFRENDPALWMETDQQQAIDDFSKALALKPDYSDAIGERMTAIFRKGNSNCENTYFAARDAAQHYPNVPMVRYIAGVCEIWNGDDKAAIADFTAAIASGMSTERVYEYRGYMYSRLGKKALALADYKTAFSIDPTVAEVRENLARFEQAPKRGLMEPAPEPITPGAEMRLAFAEYQDDAGKADYWRTKGGADQQEQCGNMSGWWSATHNAQIPLTRLIAGSKNKSDQAYLNELLEAAQKAEAKASELMKQNNCSF